MRERPDCALKQRLGEFRTKEGERDPAGESATGRCRSQNTNVLPQWPAQVDTPVEVRGRLPSSRNRPNGLSTSRLRSMASPLSELRDDVDALSPSDIAHRITKVRSRESKA